jgi:DNA integrity scanning protein DisA with diadenylate cyclase activity
MEIDRPRVMVEEALALAGRIQADALLVLTETGLSFDLLVERAPEIPILAAAVEGETFERLVKRATVNTLDIDFLELEREGAGSAAGGAGLYALKLTTREGSREAQIEAAVSLACKKGILREGNCLVVLGSGQSEADVLSLYEVGKSGTGPTLYDVLDGSGVRRETFDATLEIALEIGREGREGRAIGTAFLLGDTERVMARSRQLIINPFEGHPPEERNLAHPDLKETIKALSQLDGAIVVTEEGVCVAAGRYLNADMDLADIPRGLGTRHAATAAMTSVSDAIGITVSQSGGVVRIFKKGKVFMTVEPQRRLSKRE